MEEICSTKFVDSNPILLFQDMSSIKTFSNESKRIENFYKHKSFKEFVKRLKRESSKKYSYNTNNSLYNIFNKKSKKNLDKIEYNFDDNNDDRNFKKNQYFYIDLFQNKIKSKLLESIKNNNNNSKNKSSNKNSKTMLISKEITERTISKINKLISEDKYRTEHSPFVGKYNPNYQSIYKKTPSFDISKCLPRYKNKIEFPKSLNNIIIDKNNESSKRKKNNSNYINDEESNNDLTNSKDSFINSNNNDDIPVIPKIKSSKSKYSILNKSNKNIEFGKLKFCSNIMSKFTPKSVTRHNLSSLNTRSKSERVPLTSNDINKCGDILFIHNYSDKKSNNNLSNFNNTSSINNGFTNNNKSLSKTSSCFLFNIKNKFPKKKIMNINKNKNTNRFIEKLTSSPCVGYYRPNYNAISNHSPNILINSKNKQINKKYLLRKMWGNYAVSKDYKLVDLKS